MLYAPQQVGPASTRAGAWLLLVGWHSLGWEAQSWQVGVGGWGCFLHLSRYGPACTRAGAWFLLVGNLWNGKTSVVRWGSLAAAEEDVGVGVEAVDLAAVVGDVGVGGEVVDHTSGCTGMC